MAPLSRGHALQKCHAATSQSCARPFSSTASTFLPMPMQQKAKTAMPARGEKNSFRKKRKKGQTPSIGPRPAPGERRAARKRVVLSNVNALDVELENLTATTVLDASQQGQIIGIPGELVDRLRAAQAFKSTQSWGWFKRPAFLIRPETIEVSRMLQEATSISNTPRWIFSGEVGSGKSVLLLQAQAMALLKDWVVISIPESMYPHRPPDHFAD